MGSAAEGDNNGGGRPRSSVLKSFIHRRNQSEGSALFTSPPSSAFSNMSFKSLAKEARKSRDVSPEKPKKTKSSTNLAGFLSRPRSTMSLNKTTKEEEERRQAKDKENRTPPSSTNGLRGKASFDAGSGRYGSDASSDLSKKQRPKSYHPSTAISEHKSTSDLRSRPKMDGREPSASERIKSKVQRPKLFTAFSAAGSSTKSKASDSADRPIDPKAIDQHLEAMLDRRNIPENQRYKMRSLADTIKMEFIRQDWAEMAAKEQAGVADATAEPTSAATGGSDKEETQSKRSRGRSFTLSRKKDPKEPASPTKKSKGENTSIGRHFRSKSTESVVSERPVSASSTGSNGILSKIKFGQGPGDYVSYLRKVQKPELVEVGKLHKLRLLLRNETVSWTEDFIKQGGMEEIVGLLKRILAIEWREEHDDALLHENLLCLKALCTTALALQYLHSIHEDLFPKLLHMLFDPEKKGPSEFTTRNIITSVLFTYIESAPPMERIARAQKVLSFLRNPQPKEEERPLGFVLEMRKDRPYTVWNKEVVSVTKEVFWIFLHHLNVIALPSEMSTKGGAPLGTITNGASSFQDPHAFMHRHFPSERPPVPAAPYVGGVEWDATNYLASHLDLMNAIIACTPTSAQRNNLRNDLRISGWEKVLGGSLRLCKEKFYGCVHEALRCWVAAATEDGWDSRDVRYGPPPESRSASPKKTQKAQKPVDAAPKIEIPKLDFGLDNHRVTPVKERDVWLS
ncbi:GTPase binding protein Rid1 [Colletotrichum scovillei]|uniref:GTPase binding protein Rid1 n=1 Tax=Colletotrichum scovillei TaxID=1209932 RepID=UPI0015C2EAAB|nr:GTPase binding protein Rid1 [Colletotrichum scovillei]KAF4776560.1 GTPase binding protein Rid1 [Colletotrichum scovillei]